MATYPGGHTTSTARSLPFCTILRSALHFEGSPVRNILKHGRSWRPEGLQGGVEACFVLPPADMVPVRNGDTATKLQHLRVRRRRVLSTALVSPAKISFVSFSPKCRKSRTGRRGVGGS